MSDRFTLEELLTVRLAHTFHNGEVGFTGLATGKAAATYITNIPLAAMQLARLNILEAESRQTGVSGRQRRLVL